MAGEDDDLQELVTDFVTESREHLGSVETDLLELESGGASEDAIHRVFRAVHSVKGVAGFLAFTNINELAHTMESVLDLMRKEHLVVSGELTSLLLRSNDRLRELIDNINDSESLPTADVVAELQVYLGKDKPGPSKAPVPASPDKPTLVKEHEFEIDLVIPRMALALGCKVAELPDIIGNLGRVVEGMTRLCKECDGTPSRNPVTIHLVTPWAIEKVTADLNLESEEIRPAEAATSPATANGPSADTHKPGAGKTNKSSANDAHTESIRVSVDLLDRLMNLGGELVLSRNQLLQSQGVGNDKGVAIAAGRLNQVVSEVQESIMQTRMQPAGSLFQRLPRIVRDLSSKLGKKVSVEIGGRDVELDRSILEALSDPLTHLVRNALDHGLETPEQRESAGKHTEGTLVLGAEQVGGNVRISICDDGRGIDPNTLRTKATEKGLITPADAEAMSDREAVNLIFAAGFSTAEQVSDVSGRGVGMDVVRSNIEKIGGHIDVQSVLGTGTTIAITIPLTLAIMPAMVLRSGQERYVLAQANVAELVRLRGNDHTDRIAKLDGRDVLRLRGEVLPLLRLGSVLNKAEGQKDNNSPTTIVVVETGNVRYALTVDAPPDAEEIVVKPLGRHLKSRNEFSGATILGDGCVAMILDADGIAGSAGLSGVNTVDLGGSADDPSMDLTDFVIFRNEETEWFAIPLGLVDRIQRVASNELLGVGEQLVYRNGEQVLPVIRLESVISAKTPADSGRVSVLLVNIAGKQVGIAAPVVEDIRALDVQVDAATLSQTGVLGSFQLHNDTVRVLDLTTLAQTALPKLFPQVAVASAANAAPQSQAAAASETLECSTNPKRILFAEDTRFFRDHVAGLLRKSGYDVTACADGELAWSEFEKNDKSFDVVITDVQMPNCDGLELTRRIRESGNTEVPVVALTSLSSDEDHRKGCEAGVSEYLVKLDDGTLLQMVREHCGESQ